MNSTEEEYQFRGQKNGEVVLAVFHKSWWAYSKSFFLALVIVIASFFIGMYLPHQFPQILGIGLILGIVFVLRIWYLWSNNLYLITNLRIIALTQSGLFHRDLKEAYLEDVCQVSAQIRGAQQTLFHYGDVLVQTEAELLLNDTEDAYTVKEVIYDAIHKQKDDLKPSEETKFWQAKKNEA